MEYIMFRKWKFIACHSPSDSKGKMINYIKEYKGTNFKLSIIGSTFGFWYK